MPSGRHRAPCRIDPRIIRAKAHPNAPIQPNRATAEADPRFSLRLIFPPFRRPEPGPPPSVAGGLHGSIDAPQGSGSFVPASQAWRKSGNASNASILANIVGHDRKVRRRGTHGWAGERDECHFRTMISHAFGRDMRACGRRRHPQGSHVKAAFLRPSRVIAGRQLSRGQRRR